MITLSGKSVFGGIAIGKISFYKRNEITIKRSRVEDTEAEVKRFERAKEQASAELQQLHDKAMDDVGETNAMIFEIHQMMLEDLDYVESIVNIITTQEVNAEYAVGTTADNFAAMFAAMDDAYMQGRAADVKDVSERLIKVLSNSEHAAMEMEEPVIIAADDLVPSETVQLDKDKVLAFVTMYGSSNSHTAILARTMNIPAVIGLGEDLKQEYDGKLAIVDGMDGVIYIEPDAKTMEAMQKKQREDMEKKELLEQTIKEDLEKEAQEILKALETSDADKLSDEKQLELKKKIDKKIEDYEFEKICNELPEEYRDALRAGMELKKQEDSADSNHKQDEEKTDGNKKVVRKRKSLRVYVALAAVMIMVLAVSISSVGDGRSLMKTIKSMVGEREVVQVDSGEDNKVIKAESEEEAYQEIKAEFNINPVKIIDLPLEAKFSKAIIEKELKMGELYYQYKGENIVYIVSGDQAKNSVGMDREDQVIEQYCIEVQGINIEIKVCQLPETKKKRYFAHFNYQEGEYFLIGVMARNEFEEILKNLYFS